MAAQNTFARGIDKSRERESKINEDLNSSPHFGKGEEGIMGPSRSRIVPLFSSLFGLALPSLSPRGTAAQDLVAAVAQLKSIFEDDLLYDRLTREKAAGARASRRGILSAPLESLEQRTSMRRGSASRLERVPPCLHLR